MFSNGCGGDVGLGCTMARALASGDQPTAGYGARHGSCSGRGRCRDDLFAKQAEREDGSNMSVLLARGQGDCDCSEFFNGSDCSSGQCPAGKQLSAESGTDVRQCEPCAAGRFKAKAGNQACKPCQPNRFNGRPGSDSCKACPPGRPPSVAVRCNVMDSNLPNLPVPVFP